MNDLTRDPDLGPGTPDDRRTSIQDWRVWTVGILIVAMFVGGVGVYVAIEARDQASDLEKVVRDLRQEAVDRKDSTCRLFERQEASAINGIIGTYAYLDGLRPSERDDALTAAIIGNLHKSYAQARDGKAPAYCNAPGVGLPEAGAPVLPRERHRYDTWIRR